MYTYYTACIMGSTLHVGGEVMYEDITLLTIIVILLHFYCCTNSYQTNKDCLNLFPGTHYRSKNLSLECILASIYLDLIFQTSIRIVLHRFQDKTKQKMQENYF